MVVEIKDSPKKKLELSYISLKHKMKQVMGPDVSSVVDLMSKDFGLILNDEVITDVWRQLYVKQICDFDEDAYDFFIEGLPGLTKTFHDNDSQQELYEKFIEQCQLYYDLVFKKNVDKSILRKYGLENVVSRKDILEFFEKMNPENEKF